MFYFILKFRLIIFDCLIVIVLVIIESWLVIRIFLLWIYKVEYVIDRLFLLFCILMLLLFWILIMLNDKFLDDWLFGVMSCLKNEIV